MDDKENQIGIPEQPIVAKTQEEDQEKNEYAAEDGKAESTEMVESGDVDPNQHDGLRAKMKSRSINRGKSEVPETYSYEI